MEHLKRAMRFKATAVWGIILSVIAVIVAAFLARGTANLHGALTLPELKEITVIALLEERFPKEQVSDVVILPDRPEQPTHAFQATVAERIYLVRVNRDGPPWKLKELELLHE